MPLNLPIADEDKFELELKLDMSSEIQKLFPDLENHRRQLQQLIDHMLDQRVAMTDMKYRHIVSKGLQVTFGLTLESMDHCS